MPASFTALRLWPAILGLGILVIASASVHAQQLGSKESLQNAFNREAQNRHRDLYRGDGAKADPKTDGKVLEAAAQYYLFRTTHRMSSEEYKKIHEEFTYVVDTAMALNFDRKPKQNREYVDLFGPKLVEAMTQVLNRDAKRDPATIVHAAVMLQSMAKFKQDNIADYLLSLLSKKDTHPIVSLYAVKGLREYMPINSYPYNDNFFAKSVLTKKRRDLKFVEPLTSFIERSVSVDKLAGDEAGAYYFIRREAIITLAQTGVPAVIAFEKPNKIEDKQVQVEGLVAPTLLKVLANGALNPPPSLYEKIEAIHGLANMKLINTPDYNPDLATYLMGRTLVDFMAEYNRDLNNFAGAAKKIPFIAWRTEARKLEASLAQWAKTNKNTGNAESLANAAKGVLQTIGGNSYTSIGNDVETKLRNAIPALAPKTGGAVFKNAKAPTIPLN